MKKLIIVILSLCLTFPALAQTKQPRNLTITKHKDGTVTGSFQIDIPLKELLDPPKVQAARDPIVDSCDFGKQFVNDLNADSDDGRDGLAWKIKNPESKEFFTWLTNRATKDLLYTSAATYPVEPLWIQGNGGKLNVDYILKSIGHAANTKYKLGNYRAFFREAELRHANLPHTSARYAYLWAVLNNLSDLKVIRVPNGAETIIYVIGRHQSGDFIGVWTKAIQNEWP